MKDPRIDVTVQHDYPLQWALWTEDVEIAIELLKVYQFFKKIIADVRISKDARSNLKDNCDKIIKLCMQKGRWDAIFELLEDTIMDKSPSITNQILINSIQLLEWNVLERLIFDQVQNNSQ